VNRNRWYALGLACFVIWLVILLTAQMTIFGLLIASGFFIGRGVCAAEIDRLHEQVWRYRVRQDDLTAILSNAADKLRDNDDDDCSESLAESVVETTVLDKAHEPIGE
jgi:hypothetical protein